MLWKRTLPFVEWMEAHFLVMKFLRVLLLKKWPSVRKIDEDAWSNKFSGNSNEEEKEFLGFERPQTRIIQTSRILLAKATINEETPSEKEEMAVE